MSGDAEAWSLWSIVPRLANGFVLLGEIEK